VGQLEPPGAGHQRITTALSRAEPQPSPTRLPAPQRLRPFPPLASANLESSSIDPSLPAISLVHTHNDRKIYKAQIWVYFPSLFGPFYRLSDPFQAPRLQIPTGLPSRSGPNLQRTHPRGPGPKNRSKSRQGLTDSPPKNANRRPKSVSSSFRTHPGPPPRTRCGEFPSICAYSSSGRIHLRPKDPCGTRPDPVRPGPSAGRRHGENTSMYHD